jgi:hypothetical protein
MGPIRRNIILLDKHEARCTLVWMNFFCERLCAVPAWPYFCGGFRLIKAVILPVWRIRDKHPGSDFFPSRILDPNCLHPGSPILIKEFKYFNPPPKKAKKWFLSSKKYDPGCSSRIPDPDADFLPSRIPDPGSKRHPIPDPGSGSATLQFTMDVSEAPGWDCDGLHRYHVLPLEALALSHCWPSLYQAETLLLSPHHMTQAAINRLLARDPTWAKPWKATNTARQPCGPRELAARPSLWRYRRGAPYHILSASPPGARLKRRKPHVSKTQKHGSKFCMH